MTKWELIKSVDGIITTQANPEKDLKSCMRCKFFYGNNSQCLTRKCVREEREPEIMEEDKTSVCFECPFRQSEKYCFPCMKKILEEKRKGTGKKIVFEEQEEKSDG